MTINVNFLMSRDTLSFVCFGHFLFRFIQDKISQQNCKRHGCKVAGCILRVFTHVTIKSKMMLSKNRNIFKKQVS